MSQPGLREALFDRDGEIEAEPPWADENAQYLLNHLVVIACLLIGQPKIYPELVEKRRREGASEEALEELHGAGELAATVLQSLYRRRELLAVANGTWMDPTGAILALEQLFFSYCLLSAPDDVLAEAALRPEDVEPLFDALEVRQWIEALLGDAAP